MIDADALLDAISVHLERIEQEFDDAPTIDAVPATIEGALGYLHKVGWMQEHDRIMTEDVAPVRHGMWVDKGTITDEKAEVITEWQSARCTYCNKYHTTPYLYYFDNFAYCPNCGARMGGESDG